MKPLNDFSINLFSFLIGVINLMFTFMFIQLDRNHLKYIRSINKLKKQEVIEPLEFEGYDFVEHILDEYNQIVGAKYVGNNQIVDAKYPGKVEEKKKKKNIKD